MSAGAVPATGDAVPLTGSARRSVLAYLGSLTILLAFVSPASGLFDVPISFFLKNRLGLSAGDVAAFRLVAGIPLYLSFLFGLLRDTWHPFGMHDRGYIGLFGVMGLLVYGAFGFLPVTYGTLLGAAFLVTAAALCGDAAQNGLSATIGRQHAMTGQVSVIDNFFTLLPGVAAPVLGGLVSDWVEREPLDVAAHRLYGAGAAASLTVIAFALWRPAAVYDNVRAISPPTPHPLSDLSRLVRHRPIYPALIIWTLWNFAPGSTTPLQYHLQNTLGAADWQWGAWNAIFAGSFLPTFVLFCVLCRRVPLRRLLFWGTLVAVPQFVPVLLVGSATAALVAAVPIGLMGGVATAAYTDLLIRSCPPGLEGTAMMLSGGLYFVSARFGDVLGTSLYDRFGSFTICVALITAVYASILLVLRFVPAHLTSGTDAPLDAPPPPA